MTGRDVTIVDSADLQVGATVLAPDFVRSGAGEWTPLAEVWPDHPPTLVVRAWDWYYGESEIGSALDCAHLAYNVLDYPRRWIVVTE